MRLVRLGREPSAVGADVRAALAAWGNGAEILGGVGLIGLTPDGTGQPVDAVVILPRAILVVVGVDLPDPAVRLDAPLDGVWKVDNWDLVRPDGLRNPASEAVTAATAIAQRLQATGAAPLPVSTVIAVGPYVGRVVQPSSDLNKGIRVLYPSSGGMLAAARELATADRPCSLEQARAIMRAIGGPGTDVGTADLAAEGFPDAVSPDIASAHTVLIPKVVVDRPNFDKAAPPPPLGGDIRAGGGRAQPRSAAYAGIVVVGLVLAMIIAVAARSCGSNPAVAGGPPTTAPGVSPTTTVDGVTFTQEASEVGTNCAQHAYGDVQVWLSQHQCSRLSRGLYRAQGQNVIVSLAVVDFADEDTAQQFATVLTTPGAGNVSDLIRDGKPLPDGPLSFDGAAFTTTHTGTSVRVALAVFVGKPSRPDDENLRAVAARAVQLPAPR